MNDLEFLRELFKDTRLHIGIGTIQKIGLALDNGTLRVQVTLLPEKRDVIATMTWNDPQLVTFPQLGDLVLVGNVDGHDDDAFVLKAVTTTKQPIPKFARTGDSTFYSRDGKKAFLGSDVKVGLGRRNVDPTEPLVLGNVAATALSDLVHIFLDAPQIGQTIFGPAWLDPGVRTQMIDWINTYLTTPGSNILSQIAYTERGA